MTHIERCYGTEIYSKGISVNLFEKHEYFCEGLAMEIIFIFYDSLSVRIYWKNSCAFSQVLVLPRKKQNWKLQGNFQWFYNKIHCFHIQGGKKANIYYLRQGKTKQERWIIFWMLSSAPPNILASRLHSAVYPGRLVLRDCVQGPSCILAPGVFSQWEKLQRTMRQEEREDPLCWLWNHHG
jgi:hypothetical protein